MGQPLVVGVSSDIDGLQKQRELLEKLIGTHQYTWFPLLETKA
jgi:hypothetical protein